MADSLWSSILGATAVPLGLIGLFATERGGKFVSNASRSVRATFRPNDGQVQLCTWDEVPLGPVHVCTDPRSSYCHGKQHVGGPLCWEDTFLTLLNQWNPLMPHHINKKPAYLPMAKSFLQIEYKLLLSFIFLSARGTIRSNYRQARNTFEFGQAKINIQEVRSDVLFIHLEGVMEDSFTKKHLENLINGHPPFIDEGLAPGVNVHRAGWITALGMKEPYEEKTTFLPIYSDQIRYERGTDKAKRGYVFWRSMDRVYRILVEVWAVAFSSDSDALKDIQIAIKALEVIRQHETESGVEHILKLTTSPLPASPQLEQKIIEHFNGKPTLNESEGPGFRAEWRPALRNVLEAATTGCIRCIGYFKNGGREIEQIFGPTWMKKLRESDLYLRGCPKQT
ncbi:hypothetical protein PRZ48_012806 [Zasmidium cellare]|uniref:Uncharacterized protein n=1 Tax=Zasmidium cellare TaxID=395010 RepID=A0ABR0E5Y4_ZASCE|nr:hypothetical protein PRZ48_012806 [Zasmidium cellare]